MAKRSDFAQKLLDDLRLRKERMAASQSSTSSKSMNRDTFGYSKQMHRGSREPKTHQMNGFRNGRVQGQSTGAYKLYVEDASREIVPYGSGHSSAQIGDLSMALSVAFQNGGKHTRMDSAGNNSMFSFLNQIGRRSVDLSMMERSGFGRYHNSAGQFSNLHIEDIAKGAQRLNQILRACSNGQSFDRYSIEIGKELLKGAMDLEESLRMLVNLQEASDYMITPQRKSRITLLDEDEDENDDTTNTAEQKQLDLPIFSFDRRSRNSHHIQEVAKSDLKQRLIALSYLSKATNFNHDAQASSTLHTVSHKRSASHGSGIKTSSANSDRKNLTSSSKPKPENGRIPNVIAKLMGLEEISPEGNSKKNTTHVSSSKQKPDGIAVKKIPAGSPAITQTKKGTENVSTQTKKPVKVQQNQTQNIQTATHAMQAEKSQATYQSRFQGNNHEALPLKKDDEVIKQTRGSNKGYTKLDRDQNNSAESKQSNQRQRDIQEKKRQEDAMKLRKQNHKEKGETKKLESRLNQQHLAPQTQRASEFANALQRQTKNASIEHKSDKEESQNPPVSHQLKSPIDPTDRKTYILHNIDTENFENRAAQTEQMGTRHSTQVKSQKESEAMSRILASEVYDDANMRRMHLQVDQATNSSKNSTETIVEMKFNGSPSNREDPSHFRSTNMQDSIYRDSSRVVAARDKKPEIRKVNISTPPAMKEKSVHRLTAKNIKNTKIHKIENPQKMDEVRNRNGIPKHLSKQLKHQFSISQELKQRKQGKLDASKEDAHIRISKCKEAETDISGSHQLVKGVQKTSGLKMLEENVNGVQKTSILFNHLEPVQSQCQRNKEHEPQDLRESDMTSTDLKDQQGEDFGKVEHQNDNILLDQLYATHKGDKNISLPSQLEKQNEPRPEEPLTESENRLKKILKESQAFLNAAEAFFKLTIPLEFFHASSEWPDEETKLVQDCGYEITRRSGKIQELSIHPFMSELIASLKVNSLDELIKTLNKDLKTLEFYGRNNIGDVECPVEEYLPKMLENDVNNKEARVNCMWDIGWDKMMLSLEEKDDVIRDVEKHLLNGLLDDVTRDLLLAY